MIDDQAEWVAALQAGEVAVPSPSETTASILKARKVMSRLYPGSPRYGLELDPRAYRSDLAKELRRGRKARAHADRRTS
jgi:hypothetical protein